MQAACDQHFPELHIDGDIILHVGDTAGEGTCSPSNLTRTARYDLGLGWLWNWAHPATCDRVAIPTATERRQAGT